MSEKQFSRENIKELIIELGFDGFVDFINNQARIIEDLEKEIGELKEENIKLKNLRRYCAEWIGVDEENLYDVVR